MTKIVVNKSYGGFGVSKEAKVRYRELSGKEFGPNGDQLHNRADPYFVRVVEEMGRAANSGHSDLAVVEIPDEVAWQIEVYDGKEWIAEQHRIWRA